MSTFIEYIGALFDHGEPLIGAVVIMIAAFLPRVQKCLDQHPNRRLLWVSLIFFCIFLAGFRTWKAEHDRYMSVVLRQKVPIQTIEGGDTYQILQDDYLLAFASVSNKTATLKLPPNPYRGQRFEIKDANGAISTSSPILIDGNGHKIDKDNTVKLIQPYGAVTVTYTGIKWIIT
jgi:hypothetical protein